MTQKIEVEIGELRQITSWLAACDVEFIEISKPGTTIRLTTEQESCVAPGGLPPSAQTVRFAGAVDAPNRTEKQTTTVTAASAGVFLAAHPARSTLLVGLGGQVTQGEVVGLLQIAQLCVPVVAPVDGIVTRMLAVHGETVGYGSPLLELE
jgi:acetyl-CoA carboxylase biotin carboxyl carrier protein